MNGEVKNRSNSITSLQNMSSDNIEEQRLSGVDGHRSNTNNKVGSGQQSLRNIKKPLQQQQGGYMTPAVYDDSMNSSQQPGTQSQSQQQQSTQQQQMKKKKDLDQQSVNIVPGYKNFILDENNAAYDSIADMFTKDEIDQAFKILDYQGNNQITVEELTFFLESIGEQARPEEIEEMIKMCDLEGKGYVSREEFFKLASGQSLAPIGQAYPPTEDMLKKKEILENINLDDFQLQKYKNAHGIHTNKQQQQNKKSQQQQQQMQLQQQQLVQNSMFNQSNYMSNTQGDSKNDKTYLKAGDQTKVQQQGGGLNASTMNNNINSSVMGGGNQTNTTQAVLLNATGNNRTNATVASSLGSTIQMKKDAANKMKALAKWMKENKINIERLQGYIKSVVEMFRGDDEPDVTRDFKEFLKFLGVGTPSSAEQMQEIQKIFQDGVWWESNSNAQDGTVNVIEAIMMLIGCTNELTSNGKYEIAFSMFDKETITLDEAFAIERALTMSHSISEQKIRTKYLNHRGKKENKSKNFAQDEMDKPFYLDMVASYPSCFSG